jgi:hypothetical protein
VYNPEAIVVGPKYAIVGFKLNGAKCLLQPVVATWDPEASTSSWTGTGGELWLAVCGEAKEIQLPDRGIDTYDHDTAGREPGMMRGIHLAWNKDRTINIRYASTSLASETWLPFESRSLRA